MNFKELKAGYPIYVFDRDKVELVSRKVVSVSDPHFDQNFDTKGRTAFPSFQAQAPEMVVDVNIDMGDYTKPYVFKEGTDTGYAGNVVISTSKERVLQEVEVLKNQSEQVLSQVSRCKETVSKCKDILSEFNPAEKEKKQYEERFSNIENSVSEIKQMLASLVKEPKNK